MKVLIIFILSILSLTSCYNYQVFDVKSTELKEKEKTYSIISEDCKVIFNFWGNYGDASFLIYNKSEYNIYIWLESSSIIINGECRNLYEGTETLELVGWNKTETKKLNPVACIAPKSFIRVYNNNLVDKVYKFCDIKKDYPGKKSYSEYYCKENSPLRIKYYLAYSKTPNIKDIKNLETEFYISKITNARRKDIENKNVKLFDCYKYEYKYINLIKDSIISPKRFYIKYNNSKCL